MTTQDDCLAELKAIVQARADDALALAETCIDAFVPPETQAGMEAVRRLGSLQDRFARQTAASPLRADILDAIGARVVRLLEREDGEG